MGKNAEKKGIRRRARLIVAGRKDFISQNGYKYLELADLS